MLRFFKDATTGLTTGILLGLLASSTITLNDNLDPRLDPGLAAHCLNLSLASSFFGSLMGLLNSWRRSPDEIYADGLDNLYLAFFCSWLIFNTYYVIAGSASNLNNGMCPLEENTCPAP